MAEAMKKAVSVEKTVTVFEERIQLTLTPREAETLTTILYNVGGCPAGSRRKDADSIRRALEGQYIRGFYAGSEGDPVDRDHLHRNSIYFKEEQLNG